MTRFPRWVTAHELRGAPPAVRTLVGAHKKALTKLTVDDWAWIACAVARLRDGAELAEAQRAVVDYHEAPGRKTRSGWFDVACRVAPKRGIVRGVMDRVPKRRRGAPELYPPAQMQAVLDLIERRRGSWGRPDAEIIRSLAKTERGRSPEMVKEFGRLVSYFRSRLGKPAP